MREQDDAIYPWFLHSQTLDALFGENATTLDRLSRRLRTRHDPQWYARELERWLGAHAVPSLLEVLVQGSAKVGTLCWTELPFHWSDVGAERRAAHAGDDSARSWFHGTLVISETYTVLVSGSFNPARVTCSTAVNVELRGIRTQFVLGTIAGITTEQVEIRPMAIVTRLLEPPGRRRLREEWQQISPSDVDQFRSADWVTPLSRDSIDVLKSVPERTVKESLASMLGEPVVPNDWGGEQADLWTTRLRVRGEDHTAAFLLKGPARFRPMNIAMLGRNGDQLQRLAATPAQILVVQHCHEIGADVHALLRSVASDFRNVRRFMVLDGFATLRLLRSCGIVR